jgi:O-antigen ligase
MTLYDQKFGPKAKWQTKKVVPSAPDSVQPAPKEVTVSIPAAAKTTLAFRALLAFSFLYYARPEDFIPHMASIPVGKISGGLALIGLLLSWSKKKSKMPLEIKLVLALFVHICLTIPFAFWRGGAFHVVRDECSKAAMVALLISMIVSSLDELRRLIWVQAVSIAAMTTASVIVHPASPAGNTSRLWGLGGTFSNPNDFAINIAINFPLCLAFFLGTKGVFRKLIWATALLFLMYGVIATYSRSGMIAMVICFVICVWEFGIRGKRPQVIVAAVAILFIAVGVAMSTPRYLLRLSTLIEGGDIQGSMDHGSLEARRGLLMDSIEVTFQHPIFGIGPGNFQAYMQDWHVTHNTYTELSSETGLPGLMLFLAALAVAFRSLKKIRKTPDYKGNPDVQLFTNGLRAGLAAYMVGATFASTAYTLFPYFMVAYVGTLYKITCSSKTSRNDQRVDNSDSSNLKRAKREHEQEVLAEAR